MTPSQDYLRFCREYRRFEGVPCEDLISIMASEFAAMTTEEREYVLVASQAVTDRSDSVRQRLLRIANSEVDYLNVFAKGLLDAIEEEDGAK